MDRRGYFSDLNLVEYGKAWDLQHKLWEKRVKGELRDVVLILEHPHVITLGRRGNRTHLTVPTERLESLNIPVFHIERGGDVTYHGPGQLVIYPILNLRDYGYRILGYVEQMEEVVIRALKDFGIEGKRDALNRGVWVNREKIAAIGIAIKRWVSFHGIALNYGTDLTYFELMNPCGLEGIKMTSMEKVLGGPISRQELVETVLRHFREIFPGRWEEKRLEEILDS